MYLGTRPWAGAGRVDETRNNRALEEFERSQHYRMTIVPSNSSLCGLDATCAGARTQQARSRERWRGAPTTNPAGECRQSARAPVLLPSLSHTDPIILSWFNTLRSLALASSFVT
ncbi:hypothetical protein EVAR_85547_1 [Eumeta japonica]|uniref:Uncharacterized protein n=1 Tax=Eumeta variegata TaxID=151549 RepID=A0A4C1VAX7_EUMVA|nr:hypothetical protein EVAR_85547_1 [Eumeta japonica]